MKIIQILRTSNKQPVITIELLAKIKHQYRLHWHGTHGVIHWSRVYENGMKLAEQDGVQVKVVQYFSVFHDSRRKNEHLDNNHGSRGAQLALTMRDDIALNDNEFSLLVTACSLHTSAKTHDDITVQACFDSDRLDLGRVRITPDAKYLCTSLGKKQETIDWCYERSLVREMSDRPFGLLAVSW